MSIFSQVANRRPSKSVFNLSHEKKLTCDMATLIPHYLQEVMPGDKFRVSSEVFLRMAPTLAPLMHRVNVRTFYFFCPNRILWDGWKDFITGGEDGTNTDVIPSINMGESTKTRFGKGSLSDYFGIPTLDPDTTYTQSKRITILPFRAYQMIYNEYFRDQNIQAKIPVDTGNTVDNEHTNIRKVNWERDYLTSALPWAQKGNPISAPIDITYSSSAYIRDSLGDPPVSGAGQVNYEADGKISASTQPLAGMIENLDPDATGIDVNELRKAVRLQEWLEKNARAGSRYVESIMAHFGERVPDYTAQRPVFLGGGRQPVQISEVLSTYTNSTDNLPQGNMTGHGVSIGRNNGFNHRFTEHGYIIGLMTIIPRTAYQQGLERFWTRQGKFDFPWPEFAQLGEQEIFNYEAFFNADPEDDETFGYQARYADLKFRNSQVAGDFRDNLSFWHMGRQFINRPVLNTNFITANPRKDIFAVNDPDVHNLYVQIFNNVKAVRPLPYHNVPTL